MNDKKIIVALDSINLYDSKYLVDEIKNQVFAFKIGYDFFLNFGLDGYNQIKNKKVNIFLDLKLHDIPNTIKNGIEAIANLNPYFTTIHITGGDEMQKIANLTKKNVKVLGVSILTSIDSVQAEKYYSEKNINNLVGKFVKNALENKLDGVVCSPLEIELVKKISSGKLIIVTPGIRPENYNKNDDQKRFMSPKEAVNLGSNYLVIGRPITQSSNPLLEITSINSSIE
jgi:orotidine-5'-phosphate decarboxylase